MVLISESFLESGVTPPDVNPVSRQEGQMKKWQFHDVVLMRVTHQDVHLAAAIGEALCHQMSTKLFQVGARVDDQPFPPLGSPRRGSFHLQSPPRIWVANAGTSGLQQAMIFQFRWRIRANPQVSVLELRGKGGKQRILSRPRILLA